MDSQPDPSSPAIMAGVCAHCGVLNRLRELRACRVESERPGHYICVTCAIGKPPELVGDLLVVYRVDPLNPMI